MITSKTLFKILMHNKNFKECFNKFSITKPINITFGYCSFLTLLFITSLNLRAQEKASFGIIPIPQFIQAKSGFYNLNENTVLIYNTIDDRRIAELFKELVRKESGLELAILRKGVRKPENAIYFISQTSGFKEEAYQIDINENQINIQGGQKGIFYAMQTLSQVYLFHKRGLEIPQLTIKDEPRYDYRGLHLDVGRHFFSIDFIKKYIDLMAMYKLNNFHWHLTEDQGWRIEIKKYPKLTEVSAYRDQTIIGNRHAFMPNIFDNKKYGGFYTQEEAKEIVAYAKSKYINVIPEIEMPGHTMAVLSAYPELACGDNPGPFKAAQSGGVFPDIFCAGKEQTFTFLEDVLSEIMEIFPSKYIHIGGDEAPKQRWKACTYCQQRIKANKLKDEDELQSYFIHRMEKFVNQKGRDIIGWDEILDGGLAPNATVMSWRGEKGGIAAAKQNHHVIMTPNTNGLYFDHVQGRSDQEPPSIGGNGYMEKIYAYDPTPAGLPSNQQKYILGVQANMWTEYIYTEAKAEYMLLPRLMALSEIAWTSTKNKNYKEFTEQRLPLHLAVIDKRGSVYRVPSGIGVKDTTINVTSSYIFNWKPSVKGAKIYYTLDGSNPDETSLLYEDGLEVFVPLDEKREVKSILITPFNRRSKIVTTILVNRKPFEALKPSAKLTKGTLKYYYVPGKFSSTLEIDTNIAAKKGKIDAINITKIDNKAREYGLVYTGYIYVDKDAVYEFSLRSNDGSRFFINDELIIENDGRIFLYERSAGVHLKQGFHKIRVSYFDNGPASELNLYIKGTNGEKIDLPSAMMYHEK